MNSFYPPPCGWLQLAINPKMIHSVYGEEEPILMGVCLHEFNLQLNGGILLYLRFDPPNFPSHPPQKWEKNKYDTASIMLQFFGIRAMSVTGAPPVTVGDLFIARSEDLIRLTIKSATFQADVCGEWMRIVSIAGYCKE